MNPIEINSKVLKKMLLEKATLVVDVREKEEFMERNIGGLNVPAHILKEHLEEIQSSTKIAVICSNGMRSSIIARVLAKKIPFAEIYHLTEGIDGHYFLFE
jgi:rhodanese-related sulfurtransferase